MISLPNATPPQAPFVDRRFVTDLFDRAILGLSAGGQSRGRLR